MSLEASTHEMGGLETGPPGALMEMDVGCVRNLEAGMAACFFFHIWGHDPPFLFLLPLLHLLSLLIPPLLLLARIGSHSKALSKQVLSLVFIKILPK